LGSEPVATRADVLSPSGVSLIRDWPQRTALMVGAAFSPSVIAAFSDLGFAAVVARPDNALELARQTGPFSFLLLSPLALGPQGGAQLVRSLRTVSPAARVVLLGEVSQFEAATLVEAMRAGASDVIDPDDLPALAAMVSQQLRVAGARRERVLAIGAHPDDIEIGCAGTLLEHRRRGDRISLLTLSRGAVGGDQRQRLAESAAAADALGAQLLLGDLPDTAIDAGVATIRLVEEVVRQVDPTVVYVHSRNDNHQDHRAVHIAVLSATRSVPEVFAYQSPSATNEFRPSKFVAIDAVVLGKVRLLGLFGSQSERTYLEPELVVAGARYWARHLAPRARYAEPFEVVRMLRASPDEIGEGDSRPTAARLTSVPARAELRSAVSPA
jgi:LmbE family N-acetylglucosaminyl deacetylase/ActR/RegA family two-component response regulator